MFQAKELSTKCWRRRLASFLKENFPRCVKVDDLADLAITLSVHLTWLAKDEFNSKQQRALSGQLEYVIKKKEKLGNVPSGLVLYALSKSSSIWLSFVCSTVNVCSCWRSFSFLPSPASCIGELRSSVVAVTCVARFLFDRRLDPAGGSAFVGADQLLSLRRVRKLGHLQLGEKGRRRREMTTVCV